MITSNNTISITPPNMDINALKRIIQTEYIQATRLGRYVPVKARMKMPLAPDDASKFIHMCNNEDFIEKNTRFNKDARAALVKCSLDFSKAVTLSIYVEIHAKLPSILEGARYDRSGLNINDYTINLINEVSDPGLITHDILSRNNDSNSGALISYIFYILETLFSDPHQTPVSMDFFDWLQLQPLDTLTAFMFKKKNEIANCIKEGFKKNNACNYIMDTFDEMDSMSKWALYDVVYGTLQGVGTYDYDSMELIKERLGEPLFRKFTCPVVESDDDATPRDYKSKSGGLADSKSSGGLADSKSLSSGGLADSKSLSSGGVVDIKSSFADMAARKKTKPELTIRSDNQPKEITILKRPAEGTPTECNDVIGDMLDSPVQNHKSTATCGNNNNMAMNWSHAGNMFAPLYPSKSTYECNVKYKISCGSQEELDELIKHANMLRIKYASR